MPIAMAAQANKLLCKGEYVKCDGRKYIQAVENSLGYNVYYLIDIDSGVELRRSRYQLEPIPVPIEVLAAGGDDSDFTMEDNEPVPTTSTENTRFASVSAPELDELNLIAAASTPRSRHLGL